MDVIGLQKKIEILFSDQKSGLRTISASIYQDSKRFPLFSLDIPERGVKQKSVTQEINTRELKLHDGEAVFEITAMDHSLLKNTKTLSIKTNIDLMPPQLYTLSAAHNINPGGSCLTVYRVSKDVAATGVNVEADFFPGYPVTIDGKPCYAAFFAIPTDVTPSTRMSVFAEDRAGNKSVSAIPFYIRNVKRFRTDTVTISDTFLNRKMPEFQEHEPQLRGKTTLETFIYVNEKMRETNFNEIQKICKKSEPRRLWEGIFLRMKNSAPMAMFGDKRTYMQGGKSIGNSTHMGVDLASTQHAPVEAANNGIVVFTGYLGIYGNTVVIDHGLGVFSHYSHLDAFKVKEGQKVSRGEIIAVTGMSGFAAGDHLHLGMVIDHKFVNPIEWWDSHWIQDNVDKKLNIRIP